METTKVFTALDGTKFDNEFACEIWSEFYKKNIELQMESKIKKTRVNGGLIGVPYAMEDSEVYMMSPKDAEDVDLINRWLDVVCTYDRGESKVGYEDIGSEIIVNLYYNREYVDVYNLNCLLENIKRNIIIAKMNLI